MADRKRGGRSLDRREFFTKAFGGVAGFLGGLKAASAEDDPPKQVSRPNIVMILMDDMGWKDLACYGSTFYETPNIDRLASQGMRFTDAYATAPICSPTRASVMTGKYPARLHLTDWIPGHPFPKARLKVPEFEQQLPLEETTIAEMLKSAGYVSASIGKWHLGTEQFYPEKQGFDVNIGGTHQGMPPSYFCPYGIPNIPECKEGEYLTDRLTAEALDFIERSKSRPFFLYLSHYAVHTPLQAPKDLIAKYEGKAKPGDVQSNSTYAAMVESADRGVGRILAKLQDLKIADRTLIIFTSDNGGLEKATSQAPLRSGKGNLYEGGLRVPMIFYWPGQIRWGTTCDVPVTLADLYPTILRLADVEDKAGHTVDGISLQRLLKRSGTLRRDAIYWHYPHYHTLGGTPSGAVRQGDHKLIEFFEDDRTELYDLRKDIGETNDLSSEMPDRVQQLREMLAAWRESVNASMPTPNPHYQPEESS